MTPIPPPWPICPRCGYSRRPSGKPNLFCVRCDDQTSYDYCTLRKETPNAR